MISYADVPLLDPSPELCALVAASLDCSWVTEWTERTGGCANHAAPDVSGYAHKGFAGYAPRGPARVGVLCWPSGARRFAYGHYVASDAAVDQIRAVVDSDGGRAEAALVLDDGKRSVETSLWMLPARPVTQIAGARGLQLLTLVDDRYWWWFRSANITVDQTAPDSKTWAQLYDDIGDALGVPIEYDTVPAAYLKPGVGLTSRYDALPVLLDAVAYCTGMRIVRGLDGTVKAQSVASAQSAADDNLALRPVLSGGALATNP